MTAATTTPTHCAEHQDWQIEEFAPGGPQCYLCGKILWGTLTLTHCAALAELKRLGHLECPGQGARPFRRGDVPLFSLSTLAALVNAGHATWVYPLLGGAPTRINATATVEPDPTQEDLLAEVILLRGMVADHDARVARLRSAVARHRIVQAVATAPWTTTEGEEIALSSTDASLMAHRIDDVIAGLVAGKSGRGV